METIYIISERGKLSKSGNHLFFSDIYGNKKTIFPFLTKSIFAEKPISITAEAFVLIADNHIQLFFNTYNSSNNFTLNYNSNNISIKRKQFKLLEDTQKSLTLAKTIIQCKIENQLSYIYRIKRNNLTLEEKVDLDKIIGKIKTIIKKVPKSDNNNTLRGYEGIAARLYFSILKHHIKPKWAIFDNRSHNPPKSNVNAVLSFIYTLLTNNITCILQNNGFDPTIGFFHKISSGKNTLAYDLMEEYRNTIADSLCCSLFNLGILKENDFEQINQPKNGIYLTKEGCSKVITAYEEKLETSIYYAPLQKNQSYRQIIHNQILLFKKSIMNDIAYKPFSLK